MKLGKLILVTLGIGLSILGNAQKIKTKTGITSPEEMRSQENQVFQFMQSGTCNAWADSSKTNATLYLWIPETCSQLRGLVIMCSNVPEHMLVGHLAIRKACADNNLGIIWSTPSFMNFRKSTSRDNKSLNMSQDRKTTIDFLQQLLNGLANSSGYPEIASIPWLPMGESGHLLMVDALMEYSPERCIAGIFIKNNHLPPNNRTVPTLTAYGSAQEWGQDKVDMRKRWNDIGSAYEGIQKQRKQYPLWPLSYVIDGTSGHFDCSERLTNYFANYIQQVSKARLNKDGGNVLNSIDLTKGYLADLPVPTHEGKNVLPYSKADTGYLNSPWYFDEALAKEAQSIANINWNAATQLPGFINDSGKIARFDFNGISKLTPTELEEDGITFKVKSKLLDVLPENFVGAGESLSKTNGEPVVEWVSGQFKPLVNGKFRIALDRSYPQTANYLGARKTGNDAVRSIFQPCGLTLPKNTTGKVQKIQFEPIKDVPKGTNSIALHATSDAGLPVSFFVVAGPAIVQNNQLVFTSIPPKSKFPITVTVAAWQWGKNTEPKVKMAEIVKQQFLITEK